jgi:hypothetical protein
MIQASYVLSRFEELDTFDEGLGDLVERFSEAFHLFVRRMTRKILPDLHEHIREQHPDKNFSYQIVKEGAEVAVDNLSPRRMYEEVKSAIKTHGWKIGAMIAFWEIFEHFILPGILIYIGLPKTGVLTGALPVGEIIFYPLAFRALSAFKGKEKEIVGV